MKNFGKIKNVFNELVSEGIATKDVASLDLFKKYVKTVKENEILKTQFLVISNIDTNPGKPSKVLPLGRIGLLELLGVKMRVIVVLDHILPPADSQRESWYCELHDILVVHIEEHIATTSCVRHCPASGVQIWLGD